MTTEEKVAATEIETQVPTEEAAQTEPLETGEPEVNEEEAALEAGFNRARGITPPADKPGKKAAKKEAETPTEKQEPKDTKEEVKTEVKVNNLTEENFNQLLARTKGLEEKTSGEMRKLYGKLGELAGSLKQLQAKPTTGNRKIAASALKRLNAEYPDLAEVLAEDLQGVLSAPDEPEQKPETQKTASTEAAILAQVNAKVADEVSRITDEYRNDLISSRHSGWESLLRTSEFKTWWEALDVEKRKYYDGPKAFNVIEAIDAYKESVKASTVAKEKKKERLEAAVVPKGTAPPQAHTISDEEAFERGFKKARRR